MDPKEGVRTSEQGVQETVLNVDVFGVTMLLPKEKKVVLVDGRRRRIASDGVSVIPSHVPFLGIEAAAFAKTDPAVKPKLAFSYDVDGNETRTSFECFLLDRHTVTFEGVVEYDCLVKDANIPRMNSLIGNMRLCPGVKDGTLDRVVGLIDLQHAETIAGADHGNHNHAIAFGADVRNWAEKITATFIANRPVVIRLTQNKPQAKGAAAAGAELQNMAIHLKPGKWKVMVANIPPEEVLDLYEMEANGDGTVPLTHLELLYDLYHVGYGQRFSTPLCAGHAPVPMNGNGHFHGPGHTHGVAHDHAVQRVAGSGAHCGPPVTGG